MFIRGKRSSKKTEKCQPIYNFEEVKQIVSRNHRITVKETAYDVNIFFR